MHRLADLRMFLEELDAAAGAGELQAGVQARRAAADDDDIVRRLRHEDLITEEPR
jgi:hypothetical protein